MFRYTPRQIPSNIVVVGCGGTGSRLIPMLAQFMRSITREVNPLGWLETVHIILIDDDTVEHKNLMRQNFIEPDVGKHKATVLAQRYSRAFGLRITPVTMRIGPSTTGRDICRNAPDANLEAHFLRSSMVIMCVDSSDARRHILNMLHRSGSDTPAMSNFVIDAGNENNYGQVQFFNMSQWYGSKSLSSGLSIPKIHPYIQDIDHIPFPEKFYTELRDAPSQGSCADLDQTLAINAAMATTIMGVVQNFYYVKPVTYHSVSISLDGAGFTSFNTVNSFSNRIADATTGTSYFPYVESDRILRSYKQGAEKALDEINRVKEPINSKDLEEGSEVKSKSKKKTTKAKVEMSQPIPIPRGPVPELVRL